MKKRDANHCKACGSTDLFDTCVDREGYAVTDGSGRWTTICNDCGQDQNRPVKKRTKQ